MVRYIRRMLSIVIPAWQAAGSLEATLQSLAQGGIRKEVIVVDGGSADGTAAIAERAGVRLVQAPRGRGAQLAAGARAAGGQWLLFLHADTVLGAGWDEAVSRFTAASDNLARAAVFRFALDDSAPAARRLEAMVAWRCRHLALPYGDQGLLISRRLYEALGGFRALPLYEDVDMIRRIGHRRLAFLPVAAVTSAARYRGGGYIRRPLRNLACLALYFAGFPPRLIGRLYQ